MGAVMKTNARLTARETQIAEMLAWGAAKKEVADKLCISEHTVVNTVRNIYEKLQIQKATELCVWWFTQKCNVPLSLSPFKRALLAGILIIALLPRDILYPGSSILLLRTRHSVISRRAFSRRRSDDTLDYIPEMI